MSRKTFYREVGQIVMEVAREQLTHQRGTLNLDKHPSQFYMRLFLSTTMILEVTLDGHKWKAFSTEASYDDLADKIVERMQERNPMTKAEAFYA